MNSCAQKLPAGTVEALFNASVGDEEGQVKLDYLRCKCAPMQTRAGPPSVRQRLGIASCVIAAMRLH